MLLLLTANTIVSPSIVGCIPVVMDNTKQLIGMVTRTDLLRQHRYYSTLHYHNKGFSDSIAGKCILLKTKIAEMKFCVFLSFSSFPSLLVCTARKPIIELRKKLKKFDLE